MFLWAVLKKHFLHIYGNVPDLSAHNCSAKLPCYSEKILLGDLRWNCVGSSHQNVVTEPFKIILTGKLVPFLQSFLDDGEAKSARCDDLESLKKRTCPPSSIENPRGSINVDKDKPVTNRKKDVAEKLKPEQITQIQPQKLTLTLRSGK